MLGLYWDNGKEKGNFLYIGIREKKKETLQVFRF